MPYRPGQYSRSLPLKDRLPIYGRDSFICWYCGKDTRPALGNGHSPDSPSVDHIIPQCNGGTDDAANLRTACRACNLFKRRMTVEEYRECCHRKSSPVFRAREALLIALAELLEEDVTPAEHILNAIEWCDGQIEPYVFWGEQVER